MYNPISRHNPYIAGKPLTSDDGFYGRGDIINKVKYALESGQNNVVVLYGQRRIGKTSILHKLARSLPVPPFFPVNIDLMDKARKPITEVLYDIASICASKLGIEFDNKDAFINSPGAFHEVFLPLLFDKLGTSKRLVFLFDEFDVFDLQTQEKLPDNAAANAFHPYIRELITNQPNICFVFVVGRRMEELTVDFLSTFKSAQSISVFVLNDQDAIALIKRGEKDGAIFDQAAINEILFYTRGHPYFIQLLCQQIFNRFSLLNDEKDFIVSAEMVNDAVPAALESGASAFFWIWNGLPPAERIVFSAIAEAAKPGHVLAESDIAQILRDAGIKMLVRELNLAPSTLVEWNMLEEIDGGYRFYIEIMRRWVELNKPLKKVKEELEKISPLAETLYEAAFTYYHDNKSDLALQRLQDALESNTNHLKARLLKATIHREKGDYQLAINDFREANKLDEKETFHPFIKTMLEYGQLLELQEKDDDALKIYDEILQDLYEKEETALEHKANILIRKGDQYNSKGDMELAYQAYVFAGATQKANELVEKISTQASLFERNGNWESAEKNYNILISLQPNVTNWRFKLDDANKQSETDQKVQSILVEATEAFANGNLELTQDLLNQVLFDRPSNADANDLSKRISRIRSNIDVAIQAFAAGDLKTTNKLLSQVLVQQPSNQEARELMLKVESVRSNIENAKQYYDTGDFDSARVFLRKSLSDQPSNKEARELVEKAEEVELNIEHAKDAYQNQNITDAEEYLNRVLNIQPTNAEARILQKKITQRDYQPKQQKTLVNPSVRVAIISSIITIIAGMVALFVNPSIAQLFVQTPQVTSTNPISTPSNTSIVVTISPSKTALPTATLVNPTATFFQPVGVGKIVFDSPVASRWQVFIINPDGSGSKQLTDISDGIGDPAISPDGNKIVFISPTNGAKKISIMNADGTEINDIYKTDTEAGWPSWSLDSKTIVFAAVVDGHKQLFMMNTDGTGATRLSQSNADDLAPSFSPDGKKIAFSSNRTGKWEIYVLTIASGQVNKLTDMGDPNGQGWPTWSPDGSFIAFEYNGVANSRDIFVMNADGSNITNITNSSKYEGAPVWSPDGKKIAFASDRDGSLNIYLMNQDGSQMKRLSTLWAWGPSWSYR